MEANKYNGGNNEKGFNNQGTKGLPYSRPTGKGGRGAYPNGRQSQRIKVDCEAMKCEQKTAVGHYCLRHYRELVTEQKIQKKDGSWMKFEDYKSKFKGQKGSAQRAWEVGEYTEAIRLVEDICMMAMMEDDPGEYDEQDENGEGMMYMQEEEHDQGMIQHAMNLKRQRPDEEMGQQDFFMKGRQENK